MQPTAELFDALTSHVRRQGLLDQVRGVLTWDQQTGMPPGGAAARGELIAMVMQLSHDVLADPRVGDWLGELEQRDDLDAVQQAALRNIGRVHHRARAVPTTLIQRIGRLQGEGFSAWMKARQDGDYAHFAPVLEALVEVNRERAEAVDSSRGPYDVLLDEFEPGTTSADLTDMFSRLREGLSELTDAIRDAEPLPPIEGTFDAAEQRRIADGLLEALGFDTSHGRLDTSEHPFTVALGAGDVRITTRIEPDNLMMMLGGTIHETGHALYEQGLPTERLGTMTEGAASMGLHESQSRFWENTIGRSLPFYRWLQGPLRGVLGDRAPDAEALYRASCRVHPGLIRVTADEVTYNLHIIVRFELEKALIDGDLTVADLPTAWNDRYRDYLGIEVPDDRQGVLQDIHWSSSAFGYFPSYTLGNLYAASFGRRLGEELPELWELVGRGDFGPILGWLRDRIHHKGHLLDAPELMHQVVGETDHVEALLSYLWGRHGAAHGLSRR